MPEKALLSRFRIPTRNQLLETFPIGPEIPDLRRCDPIQAILAGPLGESATGRALRDVIDARRPALRESIAAARPEMTPEQVHQVAEQFFNEAPGEDRPAN